VRLFAAGVSLLLIQPGLLPVRAQESGATIAGTILDQAGKPVGGASVTAKGESAA